jgi:uncharacterized protein YidB (DUF937 family)
MSDAFSKLGDYAMQRLHGSPLSRIVNHLMGGQPGASGVQALVDKLRGAGLGDKVDSWVGSGPNRPVEPAELERAIGTQEADRMAAESGMARGGLMSVLSQFLPRMVDGLTPNGRVPTRDDELPGQGQGGIGGMLGGLLGRPGGQPGGGGLEDMLGGLLNRMGVGGVGHGSANVKPEAGAAPTGGATRSDDPAGTLHPAAARSGNVRPTGND